MKILPIAIGSAAAVFIVISASAQHTLFLSEEEFRAQLGANYTETFDDIAGGSLGIDTLEFSNGGPDFAFTASVPEGWLGGMQGATMEVHGWVGAGMRAREDRVPLTIDFAQPLTAVGGYFFSALPGGIFAPDYSVRLTFLFESLSSVVEVLSPSTHAESFLGITTTTEDRILTLTIEALDSNGHSGTSELVMAIPEPGTVALGMSIVALGAALAGRRLRARKV